MSSSSDIAVRVTGLSKKYRKGEYAHHSHVIDAIKGLNPFRSQEARQAAQAEHAKLDFWALKDVSFEIPRGEVLGVIGRNGAGKSTLLKVLSQITPPTEGRVEVQGRLGALLEVGTGFHGDLTGRENIYLNGAIMGMTRSEIKAEFDSIVDFSGVEAFIDTPVKRYSSGMYTRLAFAVAAHMRNEVLIVDEVLAVGDAEFQKKCLGKMHDVSASGRTVLFVSHNSEIMAKLCTQILSLKDGQVVEQGKDVQGIISKYLFGDEKNHSSLWVAKPEERLQDPNFIPWAIAVVGADGKPLTRGIARGEEAWVVIEGEVVEEHEDLLVGYYLLNEAGSYVFAPHNLDTERERWPLLKKGPVCIRSKIPTEIMNMGGYTVQLIAMIYLKRTIVLPDNEVAPHVQFEINQINSPSPHVGLGRRGSLLYPVIPFENTDVRLVNR